MVATKTSPSTKEGWTEPVKITSNKREASNAAALAEDHHLISATTRFMLIRKCTLLKQC